MAAKGYTLDAEIPVVYRLNLRDANSIFWMQRFPVRIKMWCMYPISPLAEMQKIPAIRILACGLTSTVLMVGN